MAGGVLRPGPLKTLTGPDGGTVPFYVIPFDKNGVCTGPRSLDRLVDAAQNATDVFLFSHGWNNDWAAAMRRYDRFIARYVDARETFWHQPGRDYRPILVGVFWPSAVLVAPSEQGPDIAAAADEAFGTPQELSELDAVAEGLDPVAAGRLYELAEQDELTRSEAEELAKLLAPALAGEDDDLGGETHAPSPDELLQAWSRLPVGTDEPVGEPGGFIDEGATAGAETAALFDRFDPRLIVRTATVLLMKDRAGRVGGRGVASMLRRLVADSSDSRVHLVGHCYGGKVVLSALCNGPAPTRAVESVLLLQPAMSCLCFATDVGNGRPGGYRSALERSRQPIVSTFSSHDVPLTRLFHWAVRRSSDLGEAVIAGAPPSRYAALGGYGPQGAAADVVTVPAQQAPQRYNLATGGKRIVAVESDNVISGHGDVTNPATAWALLCQVME